ncbi:sigma-54-dependent Fis family transcriptional regulator [Paracoccus yeei]|uniref:Sigma-54-dependent Fis family transcriptional regulator n=1 Tax=Paracoccus yeei TaxID=147645 RepID=A0A386UJF4_9RHOB|nr:sigma-54 dependent transcriptional regulator [Paracoccus yeei]AYF00606.1 sigma-54-dependent Fis family transcriptional regulator [Paracoccus yeei]
MTDTPRLVRLVDDDEDLRLAQVQTLRIAGFAVEPFASAAEALEGMTADYPGAVLSDVRMPGMDGLELFDRLHGIDPELPVILLTGHADVPMAVSALKQGAYDFLSKPIGADALLAAVGRACQSRALVMENRALRRQARDEAAQDSPLIGQSAVMAHLRDSIDRLAQAGGDLWLTGPGGSGKTTVARLIHRQSPRRARAFVHVPCATLDEARFEAEFLGTEAQGRAPRSAGLLEKAHRGTLYLDEIDSLNPALQARILAVIEAGELWPAGAAAPRALDLRVIASTRDDPERLVRDGGLRGDLYYRLSGVMLALPPLVERREDIPELFRHFLLDACRRLDLPAQPVTPLVKARLAGHDWPGNLRELRQFAESHALGLSPFDGADEAAPDRGLADLVAEYEAGLIREALRLSGGHAGRAMERLRLPRKTFYDKLTRHGIKPAEFRDDG